MNSIQILPKRVTRDGKPVEELHFNLFGTRRWHVAWHPHNPTCRYGTYLNRGGTIGLKACLNLPILGDFSLWLTWINPNTEPRPCPGCGKPFVPDYSSRFEQYSRICQACAWLNMELLMKADDKHEARDDAGEAK